MSLSNARCMFEGGCYTVKVQPCCTGYERDVTQQTVLVSFGNSAVKRSRRRAGVPQGAYHGGGATRATVKNLYNQDDEARYTNLQGG